MHSPFLRDRQLQRICRSLERSHTWASHLPLSINQDIIGTQLLDICTVPFGRQVFGCIVSIVVPTIHKLTIRGRTTEKMRWEDVHIKRQRIKLSLFQLGECGAVVRDLAKWIRASRFWANVDCAFVKCEC